MGYINIELFNNSVPVVNSLRIWPYTNEATQVMVFTISALSPRSGEEELLVVNGVTYKPDEWKQWDLVSTAIPTTKFSFFAINSGRILMDIIEFQLLVCNRHYPSSIEYPSSYYEFYTHYQQVEISPVMYGFTNCEIKPDLPSGLSFGERDCTISGIAKDAGTQTYTVTSRMESHNTTGTLTLQFTECSGTLYRIVRTYKLNPQYESFCIRETGTDLIIYEVPIGHDHTPSINWETYVCITVDRFDIALYSTVNAWELNSYILMYVVLTNGEEEMIMKDRFDSDIGTMNIHYFRTPTVKAKDEWFYLMGEVPTDWYGSDTVGWNLEVRDKFPESTNRIQLYKKSFNIMSISEVSGLVISIRYKYGCIVYLNSHEVWRNGVIGVLSINSTVNNEYGKLVYHPVSLPGRTVATAGIPSVSLLQQGVNIIAIALVASDDSQTKSDFDAMIHLTSSVQSESRVLEYSISSGGFTGSGDPFSLSSSVFLTSTKCETENHVTMKFLEDRREWFSSIQIQNRIIAPYYSEPATQFNLFGRNGSEDWILLKNASKIVFSTPGQKRRIYFSNNQPFNQFMIANISSGNPEHCTWYIQSFSLLADNMLIENIPFTYDSCVTVYKDVEMAEVIPQDGDGYFDFRVSPAFPDGIVLDPHSGWISGTPTAESAPMSYNITATKIGGEERSVSITLAVEKCTGGKGLMTVRFRADDNSNENSWQLFEGRGTTGKVLKSVSPFPVSSVYYYVDFCLDDGIYTFQGGDSYGDGWKTGTGYTLTVDYGAMELDIMEMNSQNYKPIYVSTVFSTYFPFQIEYTDWKVYQSSSEVSSEWNSVSFDDSTWNTYKAANIPATEAITTYIRKSFSISGVSDYQVMNVRVKYAGGVAAYLSGNLVARFN